MFITTLVVAGHLLLCNDPRFAVTAEPTGRLAQSVTRVQEIANLPVRVTACMSTHPDLDRRAGQVWEEVNGQRAVLIHIGPELRDALTDDELDSVVAHELAHEALHLDCNPGANPSDDCELTVDFLATGWIGYDAAISAMRTASEIAGPRARRSFARRVQGLERLRKLQPRRESAAVATGLAPGGQPSWREPGVLDETLTEIAAGIAHDAGLPHKVVVLTQPSWRARNIVNATTNIVGDAHAIIRVSPILVDELSAPEMRGVLAHELAHTQAGCGPKFRTPAEALDCEHKADALSARWVGRTTALRTLCHMMAISFDWRYTTDASDFIERIRLLHNRTEIPREAPVR